MSKLTSLLFLIVFFSSFRSIATNNEQPNIIIVFTDDQGYQDLGCFGSPKIKTPRIDQMAKEGIRLTDFYVAAAVCSASRSSLLTGRNPDKHGIGGALFPGLKGLNTEEVTIAEVLKEAGYATACFGKWHLGDMNESELPTGQGFDEYYGIPYSNDMYIGSKQEFHKDVVFTRSYTLAKAKNDQQKRKRNLVPIFEGTKIIEYPAEQKTLTKRYFDRAISFIDKNKKNPFFAYITPAMPHVPLFASADFKGKSERGLYGDVIEEIDWNMGKLLDYLKKNKLEENTIVIFTSDNGPWLKYGDKAGTALPLRDGKFSPFEGGVREPCVVRFPKKWQKGAVSSEVICTVDLLPTLAYYAKASIPKGLELDGKNVAKVLENTSNHLEKDYHYYYPKIKPGIPQAVGVRYGDWKFLTMGSTNYLFNLKDDISEKNNLITQNKEMAKKLQEVIEKRKLEVAKYNK